jgi:multidrug efflux pump subunit AcrA (membrane-fusion protein)
MKYTIYFLLLVALFILFGCGRKAETVSDSGVSKTSVAVTVDKNGNTVEQTNIVARLENDNKIGAIKHLYVISPYSGQVILYSTVKGKVTSSGKRLTPTSVDARSGLEYTGVDGNYVNIGQAPMLTNEVIQDDGTYGSSEPYIYWWDTKGLYHQHFFTGGQIIHVSDQPIPVKNVLITIE